MASQYIKEQIYHIHEYHPYRGGSNPRADKNTKRIMDIKNPDSYNFIKSTNSYGELFKQGTGRILDFLNVPVIQVAIVPSSKEGKVSIGLERIINHVKGTVIYDPDFLVRKYDVPTAHEGGDRSFQKHIDSIEIRVLPNPRIPLILLDDVTTTGNSLNACKKILNDSGIKEVYMVAIGRTVS